MRQGLRNTLREKLFEGWGASVKATKRWLGKDVKNATLTEMIDPRHLAIVRLLERVSATSYYLELMFLSGLAICHQAKMTLKYFHMDHIDH